MVRFETWVYLIPSHPPMLTMFYHRKYDNESWHFRLMWLGMNPHFTGSSNQIDRVAMGLSTFLKSLGKIMLMDL